MQFGIFDHIEAMAGVPMHRLLAERIELIQLADAAGFAGYHLAEHHGSDLCLAPNQEIFLAAAAQATSRIRLGPMVKILPIHHPLRVIEDICLLDQLTGGRVEYGVGRGIAAIEHFWFDGDWFASHERFEEALGLILTGLREGTVDASGSSHFDFPPIDVTLTPFQQPHPPFWYPGNPEVAGRLGLGLMWPGPISEADHRRYVDAWHAHAGSDVRADRPGDRPRVGTVEMAIVAETEKEAKAIAARGWKGLMRRIVHVHTFDALALGEAGAREALNPRAERAKAMVEADDDAAFEALAVGAGTPEQVRDRLAAYLERGLSDYIVLQLPTGDMTFEESRRSLQLFVDEVAPALRADVVRAG
ncbi:MAG: LLM class flavin-dependent oxidoreductase [Acidimicrobiia bacterium]|nr:LLM class flavin-dependent oxidoreductase [Acidimicrobiia bacterium]